MPPTRQRNWVISAIKSVQYVSFQQVTEDVFLLRGHREPHLMIIYKVLFSISVVWNEAWRERSKKKRNMPVNV